MRPSVVPRWRPFYTYDRSLEVKKGELVCVCVSQATSHTSEGKTERRKAGTAERWPVEAREAEDCQNSASPSEAFEWLRAGHMLGVDGMRAVKMGISVAQLPT